MAALSCYMRVFIFNPETDFAWQTGIRPYTPTSGVIALRKRLCLVQSEIASSGDAILLLDRQTDHDLGQLVHYDTVMAKSLVLLRPEQLADHIRASDQAVEICPWGWNNTIRKQLLDADVPEAILPDCEWLARLRALSHRRTAIGFLRRITDITASEPNRSASYISHDGINLPCEIHDMQQLAAWLAVYPDSYLKAPWSSSGRGIMRTCRTDTRTIMAWANGVLRRQGSIIAERSYERALDLASEWYCKDGKATYLGINLFHTGNDGRFIRNAGVLDDRSDISAHQSADYIDTTIIETQKVLIEDIIAPCYSGPLGIDMFLTTDGLLHPCVEINMRTTMGHISLGQPFP